MHQSVTTHLDCGLYYKHVTIVIYDRGKRGLYYKHVTTVINDYSSITFAIE
jgi:hypothetical protein